MGPEIAVFWRCLLASLLLGLYVKLRGLNISIKKGDGPMILLGGFLMGVHWVTYFYALHLGSVALAMLTLHVFPALTTLLEPLLLRTRFHLYHLLLAGLVILGIWWMAPASETEEKTTLAIVFGLVSALAYALRNIFTRKVMSRYHGSTMMWYQLCIMTLLLVPYLMTKSSETLLTDDWPIIVALALITTCLGHTLLVHSLKNYKAVTVALLSSIIPVYGIISAYLYLGEIPQRSTLIGGGFILATFLVEAGMTYRKKSTS